MAMMSALLWCLTERPEAYPPPSLRGFVLGVVAGIWFCMCVAAVYL